MSSKEFHDYVMEDVFANIGGVVSKKMFSGYGIYLHGVIFGLIIDDELYFKVGENNINDYKKLNAHPFTYHNKKGKEIVMPYWTLPPEVIEDKERLKAWMTAAVEVSQKHTK